MTERRDEDRRRAETERRSEELREAWRRKTQDPPRKPRRGWKPGDDGKEARR